MQALAEECLILSTSFWMGNNVDEQLAGKWGVVKDTYLTSLEKLQSQGHTTSQFLLAQCSWNCPVHSCRGFPWAPFKPFWNRIQAEWTVYTTEEVKLLYLKHVALYVVVLKRMHSRTAGFCWKVKAVGWDISNFNHLLLGTYLSAYVMQSLPGESLP